MSISTVYRWMLDVLQPLFLWFWLLVNCFGSLEIRVSCIHIVALILVFN